MSSKTMSNTGNTPKGETREEMPLKLVNIKPAQQNSLSSQRYPVSGQGRLKGRHMISCPGVASNKPRSKWTKLARSSALR